MLIMLHNCSNFKFGGGGQFMFLTYVQLYFKLCFNCVCYIKFLYCSFVTHSVWYFKRPLQLDIQEFAHKAVAKFY